MGLSSTKQEYRFIVHELVLNAIGLDAKQLGIRSGGASAAANAGVLDSLFKRHSRWLSETNMVHINI